MIRSAAVAAMPVFIVALYGVTDAVTDRLPTDTRPLERLLTGAALAAFVVALLVTR